MIDDRQMLKPTKALPVDFGSAKTGATDYADFKPALDIADGLSRVMNNKKLYLRLLANFPATQMAADIITAFESGSHAKVQETAHALKGVASNLGLSELTGISLQIELRARAKKTAADLLPDLNQAVKATTTAITNLLEGNSGKYTQ
ncbi:MAG: Hpt domain-containing protein [Clostridiales bacterium]|nr:Hpt domain-containing protein [Clostridiales bacterium]